MMFCGCIECECAKLAGIGNRLPKWLETASATAPETTPGRAATATEPGAAGTARSRSKHGTGLTGHGVQAIHKAVGEKGRAEAAALIPAGWLVIDILEGAAPIFFHAKSHGE